MSYRKFKLINSIGETYELTDKNYKHFFNQPKGLGYNKNLSGIRLGNRVKINGRQYDMPSPSGEMIFYEVSSEGIYDDYMDFMMFISHAPLKLYYYVPSTRSSDEHITTLFLNCEDVSVEKGEIDPNDATLHCPIQFAGLSFWLSEDLSQISIHGGGATSGDFTFPLSFPFSFGDDPLRNLLLRSSGTVPTPIFLEITGYCINPYIRFFQRKDGDILEEYAASRLLGEFDHVIIDGDDNVQSISLQLNGQYLANGAGYQDMSIGVPDKDDFFLTFLKLKPGETIATISFGNEGFNGEVDFSWHDEYFSL